MQPRGALVDKQFGGRVLPPLHTQAESERLVPRTQTTLAQGAGVQPEPAPGVDSPLREHSPGQDPRAARPDSLDLDNETPELKALYGNHLGGQSCLLARRLVDAGVPVVQVLMSASDLNGGKGDHWDTHGNNFNRLKDRLLPVFDRSASALITDLDRRGQLDETLVLMIGDFGRTPKINGGAGRDHYPFSYTTVLAGGGIRGGQVYGSSDAHAAHPRSLACGPHDLHATIFTALGIRPDAQIHDNLNRPHMLTVGRSLPLF